MSDRVNTIPKMLFINDKNMLFCDKKCEECPIKYTCYTNDVVAFDITINMRTKKLMACVPHLTKMDFEELICSALRA